MNKLFHGDNLDVIRRHVGDETIDLIYVDPPFKSERNYDLLFQRRSRRQGNDEKQRAFDDTWQWNDAASAAFGEATRIDSQLSRALEALRLFVGESDLLAYLAMVAPRLVEFHRVLKPTGTIYLHCDPTASHYLKMLMDAVFEPANMRNEIVWCYRGGGVPKKDFARKHDVILRYSKTGDYYFDVDAVRIPYSEDVTNSAVSRYDKSYRANRVYEGYRPNPNGKHPEDWWPIQAILPSSGERLGYPTQKPKTLLERIIKASSRVGEVVLDPFCGSGTTLAVAEQNDRRWIGMDVSELAIKMTSDRLKDFSFLDAEIEFETVVAEP